VQNHRYFVDLELYHLHDLSHHSTARMDMSSGMTMSGMAMYFTTSTTTPLYSSSWTPSTTGQYAGTCVFLIALATISRLLSVYRYKKEENWHAAAINRRYIVVANQEGEPEGTLKEKVRSTGEAGVLTARGKEEDVKIIATKALGTRSRPWRLSVDVPRAMIYTVQAGLGYLL